jgi:glucan-binding YG repeat protein
MKKIVKILVVLFIISALYLIGFNKCFAIDGTATGGTQENQMNIYSINVGQGINGEATLVESNGEYLLMDIGDRASFEYVRNFLQEKGLTHFSIYLSHFHGDHTGGFSNEEGTVNPPLYQLMLDYDIDYIYLPDVSLLQYKGEQIAENQDVYYRKVQQFYEDSVQTKQNPNDYKSFDEACILLKKGDTFSFGTVNANVIGPVGMDNYVSPLKQGETEICPENADADLLDDYQNNCSLVTKLVCGNVSFLTAGDLKTDGENALINEYKNTDTLKTTIYKASHHGLFPANGEEFMSYVRPDFTFMSNYAGAEMGDGKFWRVHTSQVNSNNYGFLYMCGHEDKGIDIFVNNNDISLYRHGENTKLNAQGWTEVAGGDGTDRQTDYFYFGNNGYTLKGVQQINGKYYYLGTGGYRHYGTGSGDTYCGMITCSEDGKKRYFDKSDGSMYTGTHEVHEGAYDGLYYFKDDGELLTSSKENTWELIQMGNYKYGVYSSGKLSQNAFREFNGNWCRFGNDGKMLTGWYENSDGKYYLDPTTGGRYTGFKKVGTDYYYFRDNGLMYTNCFKDTTNGTCYFGSDGKMCKGWKTVDGKTYYLNTTTGARYTGFNKISTKYYIFSDYGTMYTNCFKQTPNGMCYFGNDGVMCTGWKVISKETYYFNLKNGVRYTGLKKIDGEYYMFSDAGKMFKSTFKFFDDCARYFGADGKMAKGWAEINGNSYYFSKKGGARSTGLKKVGNYYYFFGSTGIQLKNGSKYINGVKYYFKANGRMKDQPVAEKTYLTSLTSSTKNLYVKWAKKPVDGYQIFVSTSKDGEYTKAATIKSGDTTYKKITGYKRNTVYYVKIRSYKFVGDLAEYSDFSEVKQVRTLK